jgi:molybdopterin/thiamine biosynthesis adenylyltransferase
VRAEVTSTDEFRWTPLTEIVVLGLEGRHVVRPVNAPPVADAAPDPRDLRTLAVLGADNTDLLRNLNVLIIGLGGVGSAVARLLAGYVGSLILVDPDTIESHNAPRLHYYAAGDEGTPKVAVARREILRAFPDRRVEAVAEPFPSEATIAALKDADFVFCCPDHNAVRYAVAREASRFLKPVVEAGCGGTRNDGRLTALGYHVRLQVPGGPCLACNGMDLRELEDPASTRMKRRISYLNDGGVVPGELMSLTTRAAADAVEVFLRYVTGYAGPPPRHLYFDALRLRALDATAAYQPQPECTLCGEDPDNLRGSGDALSEHQQIPAACGGVYAAV